MIAATPDPPYYAVIFTSRRSEADDPGYAAAAGRMEDLAAVQPGYLGIESARGEIGLSVSYWRDLASIAAWRTEIEHLAAQDGGRARWYDAYSVRIARVDRAYDWARAPVTSGRE